MANEENGQEPEFRVSEKLARQQEQMRKLKERIHGPGASAKTPPSPEPPVPTLSDGGVNWEAVIAEQEEEMVRERGAEPSPHVVRPTLVSTAPCFDPWLAEWPWIRYPELDHIRQAAFSAQLSPTALLQMVLLRVLTMIPPWVVLPGKGSDPKVGVTSLNSALLLDGPSGTGKSATIRIAANLLPGPLEARRPGSGEGLAAMFWRPESDDEIATRVAAAAGAVGGRKLVATAGGPAPKPQQVRSYAPVYVVVPEMSEIQSLGARRGSTWTGQVLQALMGEGLGFENVTPERRMPVTEHSYRLGLVLAAQDYAASWLFDERGSGLPQRLLWAVAHATEPGEPGRFDQVEWPGALNWSLEDMPRLDLPPWKGGYLRLLDVPSSIKDWARNWIWDRRHSEIDVGDMDAHVPINRLKIAAALTFLLERRWAVSDLLWPVALEIGRASDAARAQADRQAEAAGHVVRTRDEHRVVAARVDGKEAFAAARIPLDAAIAARRCWKVGRCTMSELREAMSKEARKAVGGWWAEAVNYAEAQRWIVFKRDHLPAAEGAKSYAYALPGPVRPPGI